MRLFVLCDKWLPQQHADMNLETFDDVPSKFCSFATSVTTAISFPPLPSAFSSTCAINAAICS